MNSDRPWYEIAFEAAYETVYAHRTDEAAEREVTGVAERLVAANDAVILDVGCGNGRHLAAWSRRGHTGIGVDLSSDLIARARARSLPNVAFLRADMRDLPLRAAADLVTSFFTSFGYFDDEDDDLRVLRGMATALRSEGRILIDYLNPPRVRATLVPESRRHEGDLFIEERRRIDTARRRVEKDVVLRHADGRRHAYRESVRLLDEEDWARLFDAVGLERVELWGSLDGRPYTEESDRMVLVAGPRERKGT
ncbi:MAG: class I SAM-dependent methyltransferase [Planctomycetota bacterium]